MRTFLTLPRKYCFAGLNHDMQVVPPLLRHGFLLIENCREAATMTGGRTIVYCSWIRSDCAW